MSGRKTNLLKYRSITDANMASASTTSSVTNIQILDNVGYQFTWTGSPVGDLSIEVSADYAEDNMSPPNVTNAGSWTPLVLTYWNGTIFVTATAIPTSVGSPVYLDLAFLSAPWIRAKYTRTSGSGTLNAYVTAKMV